MGKASCFNEAPAIPPGKTAVGLLGPGRPGRRFNEAPAIPPGKTVRRDDADAPPPEPASMRPRRFRRGKRAGPR